MKNYPIIYSQQDPRWANIELGNAAGSTIGSYGCYDTCFSMKACYYGKNINPAELNQLFKDKEIYVNANLLTDSALNEVFPEIEYIGSDHYEEVPADLAKLQEYMSDPNITVTLCVDMPVGVHFVEVVDCDTASVTIANPWTGLVEPFSKLYGDAKTNILRYIVYKGQATKPQITIEQDLYSNLVGKSTKYDDLVTLGYQDALAVKTALDQKEETIKHLGETIQLKTNALVLLQDTFSTQKTTLLNTQATLSVAQEQAKKVPILLGQINDLTDSIDGENGYKKQISTLQTQNGTLTTKIKTIKDDTIAEVVPTGKVSKVFYIISMFFKNIKL